MFFKLIPLALYAVSFVQAVPFSFTGNGVSCVTNNYEVAIQMDLTVQDKPDGKPMRLFNVGVKGAVFAAPGGEILSHRSDANPGDNGKWIAQQISGNRYYIKNVGRNAALSRIRRLTRSNSPLESTVADVYKIRLSGQNLFWEGVYGGVNTQYGYVALRAPSAGNQDWSFTK
ncbi:hypothetical protein MVEN_00640300 [Mycena venus]|uniref:Ricin B lectin domain-containing protein n=1 Tax=Mycena venus TaxID=2733690 RepID=A0A8H6YPR4_9AGAR|nr:hypothetical protein MVEN_00640300 [Mycena venus]